MASVLADTPTIVWYMTGDARISGDAVAALDSATAAGDAMPGRIITATALALCVPLLSRDGKIRATKVRTIW